MKVFMFGNGNLSFDNFIRHYQEIIIKLLKIKDISFVICDFRGVDTLTMELLKSYTPNVSIYHIGEKPRYLPDKYKTKVSQWNLIGGFQSDLDRDMAAIEVCTHFLAVDFNSDGNRISGTKKNIEVCLSKKKISLSCISL